MADIASWSPVDESNTAAPPSGWPENMQPSAVNNCARAMMGAIRRYYDTVNTQISNITTSLAGYLPLTGGIVTGNLTVNGSLGSLNVINTVGANAGFSFADRTGGGNWLWYSTGNVARLWAGADKATIDTSGNIVAAGNITAVGNINGQTITGSLVNSSGNINANGSIAASFDVVAYRNMSVAGTAFAAVVDCSGGVNGSFYDCDGVRVLDTTSGFPILYKGGNVACIQLQTAATYYDNNDHVFRNSGTANTLTIGASGNVNATAQVQGASLYSRSDINAAGSIGAGFDIIAGRHMSVAGNFACSGVGSVAGDFTCSSTGSFNKINMAGSGQTIAISGYVIPYADHGMNVGLPGSNADSMHAYAFVVPSDERLKADIETPQDCLPLVKAIETRTYRLPGAPDPAARHWGLLAQEVGAAMQAAGCDYGVRRVDKESGEEGLALNELVAVLWGACREMAARLESLEEAR